MRSPIKLAVNKKAGLWKDAYGNIKSLPSRKLQQNALVMEGQAQGQVLDQTNSSLTDIMKCSGTGSTALGSFTTAGLNQYNTQSYNASSF